MKINVRDLDRFNNDEEENRNNRFDKRDKVVKKTKIKDDYGRKDNRKFNKHLKREKDIDDENF